MRTVLEVSRKSLQMTLMGIQAAIPKAARGMVLTMIEHKISQFLQDCPDLYLRVTIESSNVPQVEGKKEGA